MLQIDTTNLHPTTESCLEALQWLQARAEIGQVLEIGCGSGILSLISAAAWGARVTAVDISPKAVADTAAAVEAHGLSELVSVWRSDGFSHPAIGQNAPYGLIICNLLAELQARLAPDIKNSITPDGYLILSGLLAWKAPEIEQAYGRLGFDCIHKIQNVNWITLLFCHRTVT